jgi:hypothetical protein
LIYAFLDGCHFIYRIIAGWCFTLSKSVPISSGISAIFRD